MYNPPTPHMGGFIMIQFNYPPIWGARGVGNKEEKTRIIGLTPHPSQGGAKNQSRLKSPPPGGLGGETGEGNIVN